MKPETVFRQCVRKACMFRFPGPDGEHFLCPKCGAATTVVALLPRLESPIVSTFSEDANELVLEAGLDNIRSILNVGSIFRTSDGVGVKHLHLFGITASPAHPAMKKTALGADDTLSWTQHWDGLNAIREIKKAGTVIWALERNHDSQNLFTTPHLNHACKLLLVVGNENSGIDPGILAESDMIVHLPMTGRKESLNVANAFAVAAYWLKFGQG